MHLYSKKNRMVKGLASMMVLLSISTFVCHQAEAANRYNSSQAAAKYDVSTCPSNLSPQRVRNLPADFRRYCMMMQSEQANRERAAQSRQAAIADGSLAAEMQRKIRDYLSNKEFEKIYRKCTTPEFLQRPEVVAQDLTEEQIEALRTVSEADCSVLVEKMNKLKERMNEMVADYDFSQADRDELTSSLAALSAERGAAEKSYKPTLKTNRAVASSVELQSMQMQYIQNARSQNVNASQNSGEVDSAPVSNEIQYNYSN